MKRRPLQHRKEADSALGRCPLPLSQRPLHPADPDYSELSTYCGPGICTCKKVVILQLLSLHLTSM